MLNPVIRLRNALQAGSLVLAIAGIGHPIAALAQTTSTVPFRQVGQHIYLGAKINGSLVTMVLDSGAGVNVLTPAAADKLGIKGKVSGVSAVGAGGAPIQVKAAMLDTIETGSVKLTSQPAFILALPNALKCDGLLGTPFFQKWVVGIDYAAHQITLTAPADFTAPTDPDTKLLPLDAREQTVHVRGKVDGIDALLRVDTGASDALTLFAPFVAKNHMREAYDRRLRMVTGRGVGGMIYGDLVRLKSVDLGDFHFEGVVSSLSIQKQGAFASATLAGNLGAELLQRFTVTFDEPHNRMFLKKNSNFGLPFIGNRTGLGVDFDGGKLTVQSVIEGSPAVAAGIQVGDVILKVENLSVSNTTLADIRDLFRSQAGRVVHVSIQTPAGQTREVLLTLKEQL